MYKKQQIVSSNLFELIILISVFNHDLNYRDCDENVIFRIFWENELFMCTNNECIFRKIMYSLRKSIMRLIERVSIQIVIQYTFYGLRYFFRSIIYFSKV